MLLHSGKWIKGFRSGIVSWFRKEIFGTVSANRDVLWRCVHADRTVHHVEEDSCEYTFLHMTGSGFPPSLNSTFGKKVTDWSYSTCCITSTSKRNVDKSVVCYSMLELHLIQLNLKIWKFENYKKNELVTWPANFQNNSGRMFLENLLVIWPRTNFVETCSKLLKRSPMQSQT